MTNSGLSYLHYDIIHVKAQISYGKIIMVLKLKTLNLFQRTGISQKGCDFSPNKTKTLCNIKIFSLIAIVKREYMNTNPSLTVEKDNSMFTVTSSGYSEIGEKFRKYFEVSSVQVKSFPGILQVAYEEPNLLTLNELTAKCSNMFQISMIIGETTNSMKTISIYSSFSKLDNLRFYSFKRNKLSDILNSFIYQEYVVTYKCAENSFGKYCGYVCHDNHRIKCNCQNTNFNYFTQCDSVCNDGWLPKYMNYTFDDYFQIIISCNEMDICKNRLTSITVDCLPPKICFPVDNNTFFCEEIYPLITDHLGKNVSSEVFLFNEILSVSFDKTTLINPEVGYNTTISLNYSEPVFRLDILKTEFGFPNPTFTVFGSSYIDKLLQFTIIFNLNSWHYYLIRNKQFRIFRPPEYVKVYKLETMQLIDKYIFVGEILLAQSPAMPPYRTLYIWQIEYLSLQIFGDKLEIPLVKLSGLIYLSCKAIIIIKSRGNISIEAKYTVAVKYMKYFKWNETSNVVGFNSKIQCQAKAFINYKLSILQLHGESYLTIISNTIITENGKGGSYLFVCYFQTNIGVYYSIYLKFKLRKHANKICLFLFANTMGSIIQCGHNGYLPDEHEIKIFYMELQSPHYIVTSGGNKYLRIPYRLYNLNYKVICLVTNIFNSSVNLKFEFQNRLYTTINREYYFSESNDLCLRYDNYIEIPKFHESNGNKFLINHSIFTFQENNFTLELPLFLVCISQILILLFTILTVTLSIVFYNNRQLLELNCKNLRKHVSIHFVNRKITLEASKPSSYLVPRIKNLFDILNTMSSELRKS